MALRAVGNLTRCDENILRSVGYGVVTGISEGMKANAKRPAVLQLAAEVIGNLASLEETDMDLQSQLKALREGRQQRNIQAWRQQQSLKEAEGEEGETKADGSGAPNKRLKALTKGRSRGWSALRTRMGSLSEGTRMEDKIRTTGDLRNAVCLYLMDDGAGKGLLEAMAAHPTRGGLGKAALRSLSYISENEEVLHRLVEKESAAEKVIYCMRACDFDANFLLSASHFLGRMLEDTRTREPVSVSRCAACLPSLFCFC